LELEIMEGEEPRRSETQTGTLAEDAAKRRARAQAALQESRLRVAKSLKAIERSQKWLKRPIELSFVVPERRRLGNPA
jgi:hypothetical protein